MLFGFGNGTKEMGIICILCIDPVGLDESHSSITGGSENWDFIDFKLHYVYKD